MKSSSHLSSRNSFAALFLALVALGAGVGFLPKPARAQAVVCVNCSDLLTQLIDLGEQLAMYAKQIQEYELQIQQYQNMLQNTKTLGLSVFDDAYGTVRNIETMMQNATNLRYMVGNIDAQLDAQYPDVYRQMQRMRGITGAQDLIANWERNKATKDSVLTALKAARDHSWDLMNDQSRMDRAGNYMLNANGNLDAIQAAGQYAQMTAQQLMKLRQLNMVQIQLQAQVTADHTRDAEIRRAAAEIWVEDKPAPPTNTERRSDDF